MAAPTAYTRSYGFADFEAAAPDDPKPGAQIDNELDNISLSMAETQTALAQIRASDGTLVNGIVDRDAVGDDVFTALLAEAGSLLSWQGAWVTATAYTVTALVEYNGSTYVCATTHTSGDFATDLAAGYWEVFAEKGETGAGSGDLVAANNLSDVANADTALANLGGTTVGRAVFKAASTSAALTAIGAAAPTRTVLTTGTGAIYTTPSGCRALYVVVVGGGGGGGGVAGAGAGTAACAGSGGGGGYAELWIASPSASYTYTVGAGGAGGAAGANNGSAGTASSFADGGSVAITANGGAGGVGVTGTAGTATAANAVGGTALGGDINVSGSTSSYGIAHGGEPINPTRAGVSLLGLAPPNGGDGLGFGAGGGGQTTWDSAATAAGGDGSGGCILITEMY